VRSIGMDVHRDFCEIAIAEGGSVRSAGRVATEPAKLGLFAGSLCDSDEVVIEATANAVAIARIIEPHVRRVVLVNPKAVREKAHRAKTDRIDAKLLARLLAVGYLDEVWTPDDATQTRRRLITRRCALVRARTRAKNQVHAVLMRNLLGRPPVTDLFGRKGRVWLAEQAAGLPVDERLSVDAGVRQVDFLADEIAQLDRILGADALSDPDALRLMTIPGISVVTAIAMLAAIGDIKRFPTPRHLVAYLGLDPRVRQSGNEPAKHGRISKEGCTQTRSLLVEAGWQTTRTPGPLRAFHERIAARRGRKIATVATARKLAVIAWHLLTRGDEYAFGRPALYREKLRRIEVVLGAPRHPGRRSPTGRQMLKTDQRRAEREAAAQHERAYQRMVADWQASRPARKDTAMPPHVGAGATPGRASQGPSRGKAARQTP
jgi:transposase